MCMSAVSMLVSTNHEAQCNLDQLVCPALWIRSQASVDFWLLSWDHLDQGPQTGLIHVCFGLCRCSDLNSVLRPSVLWRSPERDRNGCCYPFAFELDGPTSYHHCKRFPWDQPEVLEFGFVLEHLEVLFQSFGPCARTCVFHDLFDFHKRCQIHQAWLVSFLRLQTWPSRHSTETSSRIPGVVHLVHTTKHREVLGRRGVGHIWSRAAQVLQDLVQGILEVDHAHVEAVHHLLMFFGWRPGNFRLHGMDEFHVHLAHWCWGRLGLWHHEALWCSLELGHDWSLSRRWVVLRFFDLQLNEADHTTMLHLATPGVVLQEPSDPIRGPGPWSRLLPESCPSVHVQTSSSPPWGRWDWDGPLIRSLVWASQLEDVEVFWTNPPWSRGTASESTGRLRSWETLLLTFDSLKTNPDIGEVDLVCSLSLTAVSGFCTWPFKLWIGGLTKLDSWLLFCKLDWRFSWSSDATGTAVSFVREHSKLSCAKVSATPFWLDGALEISSRQFMSKRYNPLLDSNRGILAWCLFRTSSFFSVAIMAPSARMRVFDMRNGVAPVTTATFKSIPHTGTTIAWVDFKVPWFPKRNTMSHEHLRIWDFTSGLRFCKKLATCWLPMTVFVAPVSRMPHVSCVEKQTSAWDLSSTGVGLSEFRTFAQDVSVEHPSSNCWHLPSGFRTGKMHSLSDASARHGGLETGLDCKSLDSILLTSEATLEFLPLLPIIWFWILSLAACTDDLEQRWDGYKVEPWNKIDCT